MGRLWGQYYHLVRTGVEHEMGGDQTEIPALFLGEAADLFVRIPNHGLLLCQLFSEAAKVAKKPHSTKLYVQKFSVSLFFDTDADRISTVEAENSK